MKLKYYPETDSLYISLHERPRADVVRLSERVAIDVDAEGEPVGIDVEAGASSLVDLSGLEIHGISLEALAFKDREKAAS